MQTAILSESAREKYEAIKHLYHHPDYPKRRIAARFRCSLRTVNRRLFRFARSIPVKFELDTTSMPFCGFLLWAFICICAKVKLSTEI